MILESDVFVPPLRSIASDGDMPPSSSSPLSLSSLLLKSVIAKDSTGGVEVPAGIVGAVRDVETALSESEIGRDSLARLARLAALQR